MYEYWRRVCTSWLKICWPSISLREWPTVSHCPLISFSELWASKMFVSLLNAHTYHPSKHISDSLEFQRTKESSFSMIFGACSHHNKTASNNNKYDLCAWCMVSKIGRSLRFAAPADWLTGEQRAYSAYAWPMRLLRWPNECIHWEQNRVRFLWPPVDGNRCCCCSRIISKKLELDNILSAFDVAVHWHNAIPSFPNFPCIIIVSHISHFVIIVIV